MVFLQYECPQNIEDIAAKLLDSFCHCRGILIYGGEKAKIKVLMDCLCFLKFYIFLQLFQVQAIGAGHDLTLEFDWINGKNASV